MTLLRGTIERRLSALLGAPVTMGEFHVSMTKGTVEALDVCVTNDRTAVLRVPRVKAEVSFSRVLQKEVVIKSVVLERPVLSIAQRGDGSLGIPITVLKRRADESANKGRGWTADVAKKVLLVDGEV